MQTSYLDPPILRGEPDAGISTGHTEKPCSPMQQCISSADLQTCNDQNTCIVCKLDGKLLLTQSIMDPGTGYGSVGQFWQKMVDMAVGDN